MAAMTRSARAIAAWMSGSRADTVATPMLTVTAMARPPWAISALRVAVEAFPDADLSAAALARETEGEDDWMARHFFTGGLMPAADTLLHFQDHLRCERKWRLSGTHYERTANAWLARMDARQAEIIAVARDVLGRKVPCLYGGSVNSGNCQELIQCPHVDGLFIGRSAWDVEGYLDILARCAATIGETK